MNARSLKFFLFLSLIVNILAVPLLVADFFAMDKAQETLLEAQQVIYDTAIDLDDTKRSLTNYETLVTTLTDKCKTQQTRISELEKTSKVAYVGNIKTTAYTLSPAECSKSPNDSGYGIAANGTDLKPYSIHNSRFCGVTGPSLDIGSKYLIIIPEPYSYLSGIYTAVDTGSITEDHIDLYFGENNVSEALDFGVRNSEVYKWNE